MGERAGDALESGAMVLGRDRGPWDLVKRCLVLAPHPDDLDVVAVTLRRLQEAGAEVFLEVLTSGASGVEDDFADGWEAKTEAREAEQLASCHLFGLAVERVRFHRLDEDEEGHMRADESNESRVRAILDRVDADTVVLPHGCDSNADHRRTFQFFDAWARERGGSTLALLVKDPKTLGMRVDLVTAFSDEEAAWKGGMLRCHESQQTRNLRSRGYGLDERILRTNRDIAREAGLDAGYAEAFEVQEYGR
ncbi:PIG-L deacetylase family protein [Haloferula rosea]|uniref:PIG-L family deacetylase n=1 Tax=Haloferula rosea TaxID=490093 RepID=A0A934R7X4_9BACT|nr:PIG-L family deacetylase [Haloferula rosea]MBK1826904.1 PIG-L family deacetylase [Haloferula rosea]